MATIHLRKWALIMGSSSNANKESNILNVCAKMCIAPKFLATQLRRCRIGLIWWKIDKRKLPKGMLTRSMNSTNRKEMQTE